MASNVGRGNQNDTLTQFGITFYCLTRTQQELGELTVCPSVDVG